MTITIADLRAKIGVDGVEKAKHDLAETNKHATGIFEYFKAGFGAVTGVLTGFTGYKIVGDILGGVKDQLLDVLKAGMDQQQVMAQTEAVIKSTGGAAHMSAQQIGDLAEHLANMSGVSNDTIQASENLLLTFRAVGSDIFPQATQSILDMSVAMHEDLQSATIQVGKALQDPIHGVTTLQRVGVQLSEGQKELIKHFMATGQQAKAQAVILDELNKEFGGSAKAAGQTLPGQLARLNEAWDQAKEKVGMAVIPILQKLLEKYVMPLADWLGAHLPAAIDALTGFLSNQLLPAISDLMNSPVVKTLESWATAITNKVMPSFGSKDGLAGGADNAKSGLKRLSGQADQTGKDMAGPFVDRVQKALDKLDDFTNAVSPSKDPNEGATGATYRFNRALSLMDAQLDKHAAAAKRAQEPTKFLGGAFDGLGQAVGGALNALGQFGSDFQQRIGPALPGIKRFLGEISDDFSMFGDGIHNIWDGIWAVLSAPVRVAFDTIHGIVNVALDLFAGRLDKARDDIGTMFHNIWNDVQDYFAGLGRIIIGAGETILGLIIAPFKAAWKQTKPYLDQFGKSFSDWWNNAIPNAEQAIYDFFNSIQQFIYDHMPTMPSIHFPGWPSFGGNTQVAPSGGNVISGRAQQSTTISSQRPAAASMGGGGYSIIINGSDYTSNMQIAGEVQRQLRRRDLLRGLY